MDQSINDKLEEIKGITIAADIVSILGMIVGGISKVSSTLSIPAVVQAGGTAVLGGSAVVITAEAVVAVAVVVAEVIIVSSLAVGEVALVFCSANENAFVQVENSNSAIKKISEGVGKTIIPNGENLKMSKTVQNHINDIIKKGSNAGQLSRPYIDSDGTTLLLDEIMKSGNPVIDNSLANGLRWDVEGTFRGSTGTWELVVDLDTYTVVHFNFVSK